MNTNELYAKLDELDNRLERLENRCERRRRKLALLERGEVAAFEPGADLSPATVRAELDALQGELNAVVKERTALLQAIEEQKAVEARQTTKVETDHYKAAVRRYVKALLDLAKAGHEMEHIRAGWPSHVLRPVGLPGLNRGSLSFVDQASNLNILLRECVQHGLLSGRDELLNGITWGYQ
jgi:hypothetical protein